MNRERLSAVVLSVLLVASAATAVVPASALVSTADATAAGDVVGNDSTATTTDSTTTTAAPATETTTTSATTAPDSTTRDATTATEPKSKATPPEPDGKSDPKVSSSLLDRIEPSGPTADGVERADFVQVVVRAGPGRSDEAAGLVGANGGEVQARHDRLVQARVPAAAVRALASSPGVEFVREPYRPDTNEITSEGLNNMNVGNVHDAGYTGDGVTVAVVDVGFDVTNPEIADRVVDFRNFSSPASPRTMSNRSGEHGTATAELVADTAPNASIIAVTAGTEVELYEAIDWLESETDADVVTMSLSWYNAGPLDGTAYMNRRINASIQRETTWLTSAGNDGNRNHWNGTWSDSNENRWLNFSGADETMNVTPSGGSGTLYIELSWDDWGGSHENYDAYLVNETGAFVAGSANEQDGTQSPTERIYYYTDEEVHLAIWNRSANGTGNFDVFFRGDADPEYATRARSVTLPGTGRNIITVGAADYHDDTLESFSSRGPTIDGRIKPDVVAPDNVTTSDYSNGFYGTSAATPHTAGVVALMLDADESLTPAEVKSRLTESADPLRGTEPNNQTGYGLVNADAAIPPEISSFAVSSVSNQERKLTIDFYSNEPLSTAEVRLTDGDGNLLETFTENDLSEEQWSGSYLYQTTHVVENDGRYRATLTSVSDAAGSDADPAGETTDATVVDTTPPTVGDSSLVGADENAVVSDAERVTVTATVTDALSAVETVAADASAFGAGSVELTPVGDGVYEGEFVVDASASSDGRYRVPITATDAEGNERTAAARELLLDTHAPNTTHSTNATPTADGWSTSDVEVTFDASDGTSEVDETSYRIDEGPWRSGESVVLGDGEHAVEYRSTDLAGNSETKSSATVAVDTVAPRTALSVDGTEGDDGWYLSTASVTLDATDRTSGVSATKYRIDGGEWKAYGGSFELGEGEHTVEFYSVDDATNAEAARSRVVKVDTTAPEFEAPPGLNRTDGILPERPVEVVVDATDENGVAEIAVSGVPLDRADGRWRGAVPAAPALGDHEFEVVARDRAGNERVLRDASTAYSVGETVAMSRENDSFTAETNDANVGEVAIETKDSTSEADVTVGTSKRNPEPARGDPDGTALYFPQIDTSISNHDIENATVTVAVERSRVRQKYVEPDSVEFWVERENEATGWETVDARRVGENDADGTYTYEVAAPHFSTYAITGETESTPPTVAAFGPASDSPAPGEVTVAAEYGDDYSGIDPANVTLKLDGEDVTADAEVTASGLTYTANLTAGDYDASLSLVDNAGNAHLNATSFTVAANAVGFGGDGSSDGGSSGGGGGGSVPPPPVQVAVEDRSDSSFRAKIVSARVDAPGAVSPDGGIAAGDVVLRKLSVTPENTGPEPRFFVTARVGTEAPDGASALTAATLGYLHLSPTYVSDSEIAGVTVRFAVPASAVGDPENVATYRLDGGGWSRVETAVVGERDGRYVLEATASGFETLAVGVLDADGSGTDETATTEAGPDETTVATGDAADGTTAAGVAGEDDGGDGGVPGFGVGAALLALSVGLLAARRRT